MANFHVRAEAPSHSLVEKITERDVWQIFWRTMQKLKPRGKIIRQALTSLTKMRKKLLTVLVRRLKDSGQACTAPKTQVRKPKSQLPVVFGHELSALDLFHEGLPADKRIGQLL